MFDRLLSYIHSGNQRSQLAKKNILASFVNKGVAIIISLMLVPVTIGYLNSEQYGIWLTLSSVVAWISYFDVGLGHGFRNRFAESKAKGDTLLARKYVSTTYAILFLIFGFILILTEIINPHINWSGFLNLSQSYNSTLQFVVGLLFVGVCINFILNVLPIMLSADQKPALSAMITTVSQGVALLVIFILTKTTDSNMAYIAMALSWIPCLVLVCVSVFLFHSKYKNYSPSLKYIDFSLVRNIIGLGGKFFVIQISMLLIFQVTNVILSRVLGPDAVTEYNVSYKYFSITQMVFNIILAPFWSAYTEAYVKKDYSWMKRIHHKLFQAWTFLLVINLILLALSQIAFHYWVGDDVKISWAVSISMMIYVSVLSYSNMYMILLNGIGKVFLQMLIYVLCATFCIPLSYYLCGIYGIPGTLLVLTAVYMIQAIFARIQFVKILEIKCSGIWDK
jgi:O-antigen/teichoic acid export membrane protein